MMKGHRTVLLALVTLLLLLAGWHDGVVAAQGTEGEWWATYYNNATLSGSPVIRRYDRAVDFNWGRNGPGSGAGNDNFSVRWIREAWFAGGTYRFTVGVDDGVRVWVGDQLVVDEWHDQSNPAIYRDRYIPAGVHQVRVEYYEHTGGAFIKLGWSRVVGGQAWRGEYYDNRELEGDPALVRSDSAIDFAWDEGSPAPGISPNNFSVRWTRSLGFEAGTYRFFTSTDDGVRVFVDGRLVVDAWQDQALPNTHTGDIYLSAGQHTIVVEYYEHTSGAHAHVWWQRRSLTADGWHAQYFDNPDLVGGPALERTDAQINFDWDVQPPVSWMPDDNFSVRWTRTVNFTPGYYRFAVRSDDGVRVWLDGGLIIDQWKDMPYELHYVDGVYLQGTHMLRVEYYDHTGSARIHVWWEQGTSGDAPPTKDDQGTVAPPLTPREGQWQASYYANTRLAGSPVQTRVEQALDHNWGWGSPGGDVPENYFSARWTQERRFGPGLYRFTTYTDDGVRLWVDDRLLISAWRPMRGYRSATVRLSGGSHEIRMEYYERSGIALARLSWEQIAD